MRVARVDCERRSMDAIAVKDHWVIFRPLGCEIIAPIRSPIVRRLQLRLRLRRMRSATTNYMPGVSVSTRAIRLHYRTLLDTFVLATAAGGGCK